MSLNWFHTYFVLCFSIIARNKVAKWSIFDGPTDSWWLKARHSFLILTLFILSLSLSLTFCHDKCEIHSYTTDLQTVSMATLSIELMFEDAHFHTSNIRLYIRFCFFFVCDIFVVVVHLSTCVVVGFFFFIFWLVRFFFLLLFYREKKLKFQSPTR